MGIDLYDRIHDGLWELIDLVLSKALSFEHLLHFFNIFNLSNDFLGNKTLFFIFRTSTQVHNVFNIFAISRFCIMVLSRDRIWGFVWFWLSSHWILLRYDHLTLWRNTTSHLINKKYREFKMWSFSLLQPFCPTYPLFSAQTTPKNFQVCQNSSIKNWKIIFLFLCDFW